MKRFLHWLNLIARLRARRRTKEFGRQAEDRDHLADMFVRNPGLHARVMLIGQRHVHFLEAEDLSIITEAAANEPELRCKWN